MKTVWLAFLLWRSTVLFAQTVPVPNPSLPNYNPKFPVQTDPLHILSNSFQTIDEANRMIIERDQKAYDQLQRQQVKQVKEAYLALGGQEEGPPRSGKMKVNYHYPKNKAYGAAHFNKAFTEITDMVEGKTSYNLKRAVYLTEHAYDTTLSYPKFENQIRKLTNVIMLEMKQHKISPKDNLGKIMTLYRFMADTLNVRNPATEKLITTYPKLYDFNDFYGMQDYSNMFVSKLIRTGKGQCHSLPLLFLILCQEIDAKAYLSFAPEHCYIKFEDNDGNLQNIELTNQMFTTDQFILQSGYITSAAIKSKIYMDTLGWKRIVNYTLNDLANNYVKKYGYDDFVLQCSQKVVELENNDIHAYMNIANYYNILGRNVERQYQKRLVPREVYLQSDETFRNIVRNIIKYGQLIDNLGYAQMPPEMYSHWLNSLKNESMKQQHQERKQMLINMIEH